MMDIIVVAYKVYDSEWQARVFTDTEDMLNFTVAFDPANTEIRVVTLGPEWKL